MLLLIIFGVLTAIGLILLIVGAVKWEDHVFYIGLTILIVAGIILFIMGLVAIITQSTADVEYEQMLNEKYVLEYAIATSDDYIIRDKTLLTRITAFNNSITRSRLRKDNLWVGVFVNPRLADIEYIDFDDT